MLARLSLRTKLLLVVSVPLLVLAGFAAVGMTQQVAALRGQQEYGHLLPAFDALTGVATGLEGEAVASVWAEGTNGESAAAQRELLAAQSVTDRAVDRLRARVVTVEQYGSERSVRAVQELLTRLYGLPGIRRQVGSDTPEAAVALERYGALAEDDLDAAGLVAASIDDGELSASLAGIVDLRREQLAAARESALAIGHAATGSTDRYGSWIAAITTQRSLASQFLSGATPRERRAFEVARRGAGRLGPVIGSDQELPAAFPADPGTPDSQYARFVTRQTRLDRGIRAVQGVVNGVAADREGDARRRVLVYGVGAALLMLLVLGLTRVVLRSATRPLRSLTRAARDVAERRLPRLVETLRRGGELDPTQLELAPIDVDSHDEIGDLARAFNAVQQTTVSVAEQQATLLRTGIGELYLSLARRNQSLLDRQIGLLDELEAHAEDPDQLEALFRLDHLATRMRRNAENLLVLSGGAPSRQLREPAPIVDVARAASAEITDFERIVFQGLDDLVAVTGSAVSDVTHLLAELLENATSFSPPGSPVVVAGARGRRRFILTVTDEGIGMDDEALVAANAMLQRPPAPGLALSRRLGLLVVGHLAARYGIAVQLRRSPTRGITAVVALPAMVLTRAPGHGADAAAPSAGSPVDASPAPAETAETAATAATAETADPPHRFGEPGVGEPGVGEPGVGVDEPAPVAAEVVVERVGPEVVTADDVIVLPPEPAHVAATPSGSGNGDHADAGAGPTRLAWSAEPPGAAAPPHAASGAPTGGGDPLPRRVPGESGPGAPGDLPTRVPGANLTHRPGPGGGAGVGTPDGETRPRPERVHELLTQHLRGIRDGRDGGEPAPGPGPEAREDPR